MGYDNHTEPIIQYNQQRVVRPPEPPKQKRKKKRGCLGCLGRTFLLLGFVIAIAVGGIVAFFNSGLSDEIAQDIERLAEARTRTTFETTRILDRNGNELWQIFGEGRRTYIPFEKIPLEIQLATISIEDDTFYTNKGFDESSLAAAILANWRMEEGERPIGASTITQQLVRHVSFDYEEKTAVSYKRKAKEIFLAWRMNKDYTKDEILELYLNEIYYGNLAYGIEAAAKTYFGKSANDLTLGEASLLAGIPQSPAILDPYTNLEKVKARQWIVLLLMYEEGYINKDQADQAYLEELSFLNQTVSLNAPHFSVYVRQQLEEMFGAEVVASGGLQVTTTLDLEYQRIAQQLATERVNELANSNVNNASLLAMHPRTGEILAMLGSVDYGNDAINGNVNITLSKQQPGSTIKPITFASALSPNPNTGDASWKPGDILWDVPVQYPQYDGTVYAPRNYDEDFHGPMRLRTALANSYNIPSVLLLQDIGLERMISTANQMGLESIEYDPAKYGLSLTLGGVEVSPFEMTQAYAILANQGNKIPPVSILRVESTQGELLYEYNPPPSESVLDERVAYVLTDFLDDDIARIPELGEFNPLDLPFPAAAKTGTTNDFRDSWTIGYTPDLVVTVWMGNSDNSPMFEVSGLGGAAPLWSNFMQTIYANDGLMSVLQPAGQFNRFQQPVGMQLVDICEVTEINKGQSDCQAIGQEWEIENLRQSAEQFPFTESFWDEVNASVVSAVVDPERNCIVSKERWSQDVTKSLYIQPPRNIEAQQAAIEWANNQNLAILPTQLCDVGSGNVPEEQPTHTPWPTNTPEPVTPTAEPIFVEPTPEWIPPTAPPKQWQPTNTPAWVAPKATTVWKTPTPWPTKTAVAPTLVPQAPATPWSPPTATPQVQATAWSPPPVNPTAISQPTAWSPPPVTPTAIPQPTATRWIPTPAPIIPTAVPQVQPVAPVGNSANGATWVITSPTAGQKISQNIPIVGTVQFSAESQFYKIELRRSDQSEWTTLGQQQTTPVTNGTLETLNTAGLLTIPDRFGAGLYELRLIVVGSDSNYMGTPFTVSIELVE